MKLFVFSVRDSKAECFGRPYCSPHAGSALRSFQDEINREDKDNPLWLHPEDYDLYQLAIFDDATGSFEIEGAPKMRLLGRECTSKRGL